MDSTGNILLAGQTAATDFPAVNATQGNLNGHANGVPDGFVAKIDKSGAALVYSTYLGGSDIDVFQRLALDSNGSAWVTGQTQSRDFPVLNAAQAVYGGGGDAVVAKLDQYGALLFSSYLGGPSYDAGIGVAVDRFGSAYVSGSSSGSFPTTPGTLQPPASSPKVFVTKYAPAGSIVYSTLLGGDEDDEGGAIAVDSGGNAYITGFSASSTFTGAPAGGAQPNNNGNEDAFVAKLNPNGTGLTYFTFLGGSGLDEGIGIAVDSLGNAYVAGQTGSAGLATPGAAQTASAGGTKGFVAKLNPAGAAFEYLTYIGGTRSDYLNAMALDASGNVYVAGRTESVNFPLVSALQSTLPGNTTSLFSSTDSGGTWTASDSNIPGVVSGISLNPAGSSAVVLTDNGIYRTVDGGASWSQQFSLPFGGNFPPSRSPISPGTIYAMDQFGTIDKSADDGVTWTSANAGLPMPGAAGGILADPLESNTVYAFGFTSPPYVFKSVDAGVTWNPAGPGLPGYVTSMVATSDGALYADAAYGGIYKSTDQGVSWNAVNNGLPLNSYSGSLSLSASGITVYFASGGIYKTTNGGSSWSPTSGSANAEQIATSPQNSSILYALTNNIDSGID